MDEVNPLPRVTVIDDIDIETRAEIRTAGVMPASSSSRRKARSSRVSPVRQKFRENGTAVSIRSPAPRGRATAPGTPSGAGGVNELRHGTPGGAYGTSGGRSR